jgi:hypothetical protein
MVTEWSQKKRSVSSRDSEDRRATAVGDRHEVSEIVRYVSCEKQRRCGTEEEEKRKGRTRERRRVSVVRHEKACNMVKRSLRNHRKARVRVCDYQRQDDL